LVKGRYGPGSSDGIGIIQVALIEKLKNRVTITTRKEAKKTYRGGAEV